MARINDHYLKLAAGYLFPEIEGRTRRYLEAHPDARLIRLGIGDVVRPLPASVREAMKDAIDELGSVESFRGYPPAAGYDFLREAISTHDFQARGCDIAPDEIYVSDGSKCDSANIQEIFASTARFAVPDPVYPVYVDTNVMAGRTGAADADGRYAGVTYLPCTEQNGFLPAPPDEPVDLVYLCFPNNPTGTVAGRDALGRWVEWALANEAILLFDAAYEAYISEEGIPHSIFEIPGARKCAIEFRSYSKSVGFTGVRCAYIAIPNELCGRDENGESVPIHKLWARRHSTKFNGVSYPVQVGATAAYSDAGRAEIRANVEYYLENAAIIREGLKKIGLTVYAGVNAPYIWLKTPNDLGSWDLFDQLLERAQVVGTPGAGFGACGEGFFRLSAFGHRDQIEEAVERIHKAWG
jgi:LL-diaminopimelate aminotransferase